MLKRRHLYGVHHSPWTKSVLCLMPDLSAKCEAPGVRWVASVPPAHNWNWINQCSGASVGKGVKMKMISTATPSPEDLGQSWVKRDRSRRGHSGCSGCVGYEALKVHTFCFASCLCALFSIQSHFFFCPICFDYSHWNMFIISLSRIKYNKAVFGAYPLV